MNRPTPHWFLSLSACVALGVTLGVAPLHGAFVLNPSFESSWNSTWPHYGSIDDWTGGNGVNDRSLDRGGPFHDNGLTPDGNRVAFKQQGGDVSQLISGLTIGQTYWIQFYYNTRGDVLTGTCDITTRFNGVDLDSVTGIQRVATPEGSGPITAQFYARSVPFVADVDSGYLTFHVNTVGDRTALFDAVTIVARDSNDMTLMNPSFEAGGSLTAGTPMTGQIAGWTATGSYGVDLAGGPYADNGLVPDQDLVAFIEGPGSLSQTIRKLVVGTQYQLMFAYNARSGNAPHLQVTVGGTVVLEKDVTPVGGTTAFQTNLVTFTASSTELLIAFTQTKAGTDALLLDNVRVIGQTAVSLPPIQVSPLKAELAPGQSLTVTCTVPSEKLATSSADITFASSDISRVRFPAAGSNGTVTLHYDKGGATSKTIEAVGVKRGAASINVTESAGLDVTNGVMINVVESFVRNPSFEADAAPSGIGVGPVLSWTGTGTYGVNTISQPFAANSGTIPDRMQVAIIQGVGSVSQQITGLTPGANYWLQFRYALRDISDPSGPAADLAVSFGGQTLATISHIVPLSQAGLTEYYFTNIVFAPTSSSGTLTLATVNPQGDASVLLDAINIVRREPGEVVVQNPSFEASGAMDLYIEGPNTAPLGGWTISGGGRGTASTTPFADNGLVPDQDQALFLQGATSAYQTVPGLTAGQKYTLVYSVNSRGCCGTDLTTHYAVLTGTPGAAGIVFEEDLTPLGGTVLLYPRRYAVFTADASDQEIRFQHIPAGDKTLLLDDVRLLAGEVTEPPLLAISMHSDGKAQLHWPAPALGYVLQSTTSLSGPWAKDGAAISTQGSLRVAIVEPTAAIKYYRLSL